MTQRPRVFSAALLVAVASVFQGCSGQPAQEARVEHNRSMIRAYVDAANRGDESYLDEYFGPGYAYHGPGGELDAAGFKQFHHGVLAAFPGATMTVEDMVAAEDEVATRWTLHGVQKGEFHGIRPTGKPVTISGIIISRFEGGKVVEEWEEADVLQQLGMPAGPQGGL